ncbi:acetolactate synthase catalytic subunit [Fictibacillus macauensis ZFHKF-1]|uniref:Acetolactate synthase n=1 Tax=Fictibacillus macauensis ZFHKF-1 TaxID=1196324 RepID=I8J0U3_9BACL|nr:acetolactate synthase catalytic subunit [Fictibacillus macauensis ZFHKF-1]
MAEKERKKTTTMSGAEMLMEALEAQQVDVIFGYPGGAVLPIYDALYKRNLQHILTRHEQGAIHAAQGYARVTGKAGVVIATSGPGATNLVTGIADAMIDSLPLVIFTGQVATSVIGTDAFQEADIVGITMPITKHNVQVQKPEDLPRMIAEAFHIAQTGRPGPVVIDIPKDVSTALGDYESHPPVSLPGYEPTVRPNVLQVKRLMEAVTNAKRPVILAGAGVLVAKGEEALRNFAEQYHIPVANTLLGLGTFPYNHDLFLGMAGMHGTYAANMALYDCDLLIGIGARFDDRLTGNLNHFASKATIAHIDIDPAEIGKIIEPTIPIVGCAKQTLQTMLALETERGETQEWVATLANYKEHYPLWYDTSEEVLKPQQLLQLVHEETKGEAVVTTDVGQHQMWSAQYYGFTKPNRWVTSGGLGTMGFGFPAAIGAKMGKPDLPVVAIVGDGGFQMTLQELSVLQERQLAVIVIIVNNQSLGMVRQWQQIFYEERYSQSLLPVQPDFVKLAEAYNIPAATVSTPQEVRTHVAKALHSKGPYLLDCRVASDENVYPMIAPGQGIHQMLGVKK